MDKLDAGYMQLAVLRLVIKNPGFAAETGVLCTGVLLIDHRLLNSEPPVLCECLLGRKLFKPNDFFLKFLKRRQSKAFSIFSVLFLPCFPTLGA